MSELRLTGKTPDGVHLTLTNNDGAQFTLRISDTLRATVNQPRLTSVPVADENAAMSVRDMQRRLRAGETMDAIARDGNISVDKVERFAGPILQERLFIIDQVHSLTPRREGKDSGREALTFLDILTSKLSPLGVDTDSLDWNTWRLDDGTWTIELHYPNRDGMGAAQFSYDTHRRTITPLDDNAAWMMGEDAPIRRIEPGLIYADPTHPSRTSERVVEKEPIRSIASSLDDLPDNDPTDEELEAEISRETPRLVSIRETPAPGDKQDGITSRAKVPSWDEIMFGQKPTEDPENAN
ncbi:MAG: septation protein SepH [Actinomycetota bacterium]|nr:septation protein SepH [Actinomycetota bacterium]